MNLVTTEMEAAVQDGSGGVDLAGLDIEQLRRLSILSPMRSVAQIGLEWIAIAGAIYVCTHYWNLALYVLAVAIIGARQHALLILMHEGAHYRLCGRRLLNDALGELLAWPFFITMRSYRRNHLAHHRYTNTTRDPDWNRKLNQRQWIFPKHWLELAGLLLADLSGLKTVGLIALARSIAGHDAKPPRWYVIARLGFYLTIAGLLVAGGGVQIFLLYWMVPYLTWLAMVLHLRSIAEHFSIPGPDCVGVGVRTTRLNLLERLLLAPNNINYHAEHHRFPSVPFYRLPELHRLAFATRVFASQAHLSHGYLGVLRECCARPPQEESITIDSLQEPLMAPSLAEI